VKSNVIIGIVLILLFVGMLTLAFDIQPVKSDWTWTETIYIRADGSVEPDTAPISTVDNITYTFTDNIVGDFPEGSDAIVVERDNIIVDGAGYTLQGNLSYLSSGIFLPNGISNITIQNTRIKGFYDGIYLDQMSSNNTLFENNITNNSWGIAVWGSFNNSIHGNNIMANDMGITVAGALIPFYNAIFENKITNNTINGITLIYIVGAAIFGNSITANNNIGINLVDSNNNTICENNIASNEGCGVRLAHSSNNILSGNNITSNNFGIRLDTSATDNKMYHNNFINNTQQVETLPSPKNIWDDGYPSGGNYWSNYTDVDLCNGPHQNITGSDGIWDHPYIIDANNTDNYPLISSWPLSNYTLTITAIYGGTTNPSYGIYTYIGGTTVQVTATPKLYYVFDHWQLDGSTEYSNPINVTMNANHTLHVVFKHFIPPSVGGIYIPVNKLSLLTPYIALASTIIFAISILVAYTRYRKKQ
jgi:parallel beta-helix repeat protein